MKYCIIANGERRWSSMKMKTASHSLLFGVLIAMFALTALPVQAADFSGYTKATYNTDWIWGDSKYSWVAPPSGKSIRAMKHASIKNIADFQLKDAIFMIGVTEVELYDENGNVVQTITDPAEIAQVVRLDNAEEMWQGNYVVRLGTIQPEHMKRCLLNWWYGELLASWEHSWVISYEYESWQGVWYLP